MTDATGPTAGGAPAPGWWQASDGNWYPPEQRPGAPTPPPPSYVQYGGPPPASNGMATASMVTGIVSLLLFWAIGLGTIIGIVALVLGIVALQKAKDLPERTGRGQAITGIVTGVIGGFAGIFLIVGITFLGSAAEDKFEDVGERLDSGLNTDPPDGRCDMDRYIEDPDC